MIKLHVCSVISLEDSHTRKSVFSDAPDRVDIDFDEVKTLLAMPTTANYLLILLNMSPLYKVMLLC